MTFKRTYTAGCVFGLADLLILLYSQTKIGGPVHRCCRQEVVSSPTHSDHSEVVAAVPPATQPQHGIF